MQNELTDEKKRLVIEFIKGTLSKGLKLPVEKIEDFVPFENYGIDSILTMKLTSELEKAFGSLSKTLFFEYRNVEELSEYFYNNYAERLSELGVFHKEDVKERTQINRKSDNGKDLNDKLLGNIFGKINYKKRDYPLDNILSDIPSKKRENVSSYKDSTTSQSVAIVGLAGKYPKAENIDELWENLLAKRDCIDEIPKERFDIDLYYNPDKNAKKSVYSRYGGFIDGIDEFDPMFFHIAPKEAKNIDPQERLFLECSYHAMEDAGYTRENISTKQGKSLGCKVGVYVGVLFEDYQFYGIEEQMKENLISVSGVTANIANRVSYIFNFNGPSMTIGTQCSSSLTAIHLARNSILNGECDAAIAGGVNICLHPNKYILLAQGKFLSSDGKCLAFGADGDGYVPSEGVGAVVLKRLDKAIEDNDHIYGIIKSSAINHGGKTNGYTVPNPIAQAEVIGSVYEEAGINPRTVSYLEAHGTGTALGDPIEINGLCRAFEKSTKEKQYCEIGSIKSNIGHCEGAAGIASVSKVLMQMKYRKIVPSIHSEILNPYIDFANTPFHVTQEVMDWENPVIIENGKEVSCPLRAGISSFGAGGSNAHLLIEEYNQEKYEDEAYQKDELIVISAKTEEQVKILAAKLKKYLENHKEYRAVDISYTLLAGRERFENKLAFYAKNVEEIIQKLEDYLSNSDKFVNLADSENKNSLEESAIDFHNRKVRKVSLPGYPFLKQKYWMEKTANNSIKPLESNLETVEEVQMPEGIITQGEKECCQLEKTDDMKKYVISDISEIIEGILEIPKKDLSYEEKFVDLGFDSLSIVEFSGVLGEKYGITLTPDIIYSYQNINILSEYLVTEYNNFIKELHLKDSETPLDDMEHVKKEEGQKEIVTAAHTKENVNQVSKEQIAIVGRAGRFPNARNVEEFWEILSQEKDVIRKVPEERKNWNKIYEGLSDEESKKYRIGVIPGVDEFDADFFDITPIEAESMDPRQRLLLMEMWNAIEDAGFNKEYLQNRKVGVFVGAEDSDYRKTLTKEIGVLSNHNAALAARLAYMLDLHGSNLTLNTACSSSLVALHLAKESILNGDCDSAIVAGVNILPTPDSLVAMQSAGMISPDCVCSPFGKNANGMVAAEAAAVVVLERESLAQEEGRRIYATIAGSGINYDGMTNGLSAPSGRAQMSLINEIYDRNNIDVEKIGYVIAHGTGTKLGDPIEVNSLSNVFRSRTDKKEFCALGSVKGNIGHTQAASGLVSLIALIEAMRKGIIPASIHCEEKNSFINWVENPFVVKAAKDTWKESSDGYKYGAVSAFGVTGTNAHVVIKSKAHIESQFSNEDAQLLVVSAKSKKALYERILALKKYVEQEKPSLRSLAYTLYNGRIHLSERCAFAARDIEHACQIMDSICDNYTNTGAFTAGENIQKIYYGRINSNWEFEQEICNLVRNNVEGALENGADKNTYFLRMQQIAEFYCKGYEKYLADLFAAKDVTMIDLPAYPFELSQYWGTKDTNSEAETGLSYLHPLLHRNCSTLKEQVFVSVFTGEEDIFTNHIINGTKILPGVVCLEMALEAIKNSVDDFEMPVFKNIGWYKPVTVHEKQPCTVRVRVFENVRNEIEFYVESSSSDEFTVNCKGIAINEKREQEQYAEFPADLNEKEISGDDFYNYQESIHMHYGEKLRNIKEIRKAGNVALSYIKTNHAIDKAYTLYYGILDCAFQSVYAFADNEKASAAMAYAISRMVVYSPLVQEMKVIIKHKKSGAMSLYDFDLCDMNGKVCVHIEGFAGRSAKENKKTENTSNFNDLEEAVDTTSNDSKDKIESDNAYMDRVVRYLCEEIAKALKYPVERIKPKENFESLGLDSILVLHLIDELEEKFGSLPKTLFFEYSSATELSKYFINNHAEVLNKYVPKAKEKRSLEPQVIERKNVSPARKIHKVKRSYDTIVSRENDIAIIGLSGKYPQADNTEEFFENLCKGLDCVTEIPEERWNYKANYDTDKNKKGKIKCKWGGFINGVDEFDPLFFHISPREAEITDPQERLFLQCVYATIEDAGYKASNICESQEGEGGCNVGVFVGASMNEYPLYGAQEQEKGNMIAVNGINASIANRVSYFFNFSGPSMSLDTQCSSSLTAIHLACNSIRNGDCDAAIAGGVNLSIHQNKYLLLSNANFVASNGRCKSFGAGGEGYVPGEGVGSVLLKPLSKAIEAGDHIYGVIKGSSINHGGKTTGYTVPNPNAQSRLIEKAILNAGVDARDISYIETHGTGTVLGDPIEMNGLNRAFAKFTDDRKFCAIGSVKSNIGHCEAAAGIAALTKVLMQMKYKKLVPSIHSEVLNPYIDFENTPFVLQRELADWTVPQIDYDGERKESRRIAGISSFGAGGSNAHVIVEEYETDWNDSEIQKPLIFIISAKKEEQLTEYMKEFLADAYKNAYTLKQLEAISYTLATGREQMDYRIGFVASTYEEYVSILESYVNKLDDGMKIFKGKANNQNGLSELLDYEDFKDVVMGVARKGNYEKLIKFWINGYDIDFEEIMDVIGISHQRISLPTYPFARNRYWIPGKSLAKAQTDYDSEPQTVLREPASNTSMVKPLQTFEVIKPFWTKEIRNRQDKEKYERKIVICIGDQNICDRIKAAAPDWEVINYEENRTSLLKEGFTDAAVFLFSTIKEILKEKNTGKIRLVILANDTAKNLYYGLSGLSRTIAIENPMVASTFIELDGEAGVNLADVLLESSDVRHVRYRNGERYIQGFESLQDVHDGNFKFGGKGVYVITGGAGGLGRIFASEIANTSSGNVIVLTGRTKMNSSIEEFLNKLKVNSNTAVYIPMDVQDYDDVKKNFDRIRTEYGKINGIIHAAGINLDNYIIKKTREEFIKVLAPKVSGLVNIDEATKNDDLDFFVCFSSVSGCFGNAGQSDYATANSFMDGYVERRNALVQKNERKGRSYSINWPLWRNGGMHVDAITEKYLEKHSGLSVLSNEAGISAFYCILSNSGDEYICIAGDETKYGKLVGGNARKKQRASSTAAVQKSEVSEVIKSNTSGKRTSDMKYWSVKDCIKYHIKEKISEILKIAIKDLEDDVAFEMYGFDSVSLIELSLILTDFYEFEITPDKLYSYSSVNSLAEYLLKSEEKVLNEMYSEQTQAIETSSDSDVDSPLKEQYDARESQEIRQSDENTIRDDKHSNSEMLNEPETRGVITNSDFVSIIGMSGRFPGADNVDDFFQLLVDNKDVVAPVSSKRQEWEDVYKSEEDRKKRRIGEVKGVGDFEPLFFDISPREAISMDPRQRLLLEEMWKALEDAGYSPESAKNERIGVFVGAEETDYRTLLSEEIGIVSNHNAALSARLAYYLDLKGTNFTINTACSSSLMAFHQAVISIMAGDCDAAVVGGVNLLVKPDSYLAMEASGMLSEDGTTHAFDKKANGMVPGEAIAAIVIKRTDLAKKCKNPIYATVAGSGTNYDGKSNGITAPSGQAQVDLLTEVYRKYKINPRDLDCVITHGTGTRLGDSIEINSLSEFLGEKQSNEKLCALTSVKPNVGHCLAASGIVSLIALVKALEKEMIPASIHCEEVNDFIQWDKSPFYVNTENKQWKADNGKSRLGAVSAFGITGSNAHVIVRGVNKESTSKVEKPGYLLPFSARTKESLKAELSRFAAYLELNKDIDLSAVSYTLMYGRKQFEDRVVIIAENVAQAAELIKKASQDEKCTGIFYGKKETKFKQNDIIATSISAMIEKLNRDSVSSYEYHETLNALAEYYIAGYDTVCRSLFSNTYQLLHLPTYQFNNASYWPKHNKKVDSSSVSEDMKAKPAYKESTEEKKLQETEVKKMVSPSGKVQLPDKESIAKLDYTLSDSQKTKIKLQPLEKDAKQAMKHEEGGKVNQDNNSNGLQMLFSLFEEIYNGEFPIEEKEDNKADIVTTEPDRNPDTEIEKDSIEKSASESVPEIDLDDIIATVRNILSDELFVEKGDIGLDTSFHELGVDSVIGVDIVKKINQQYKIKMTAVKIYQYPTLGEMSQYIKNEISNMGSTGSAVVPSVNDNGSEKDVRTVQDEKAGNKGIDEIDTEFLVQSLAEELFIEPEEIDLDASFLSLGLDSIISVNWVRTLSKKYGIDINTTKIYQYPSINELAEYIANQR